MKKYYNKKIYRPVFAKIQNKEQPRWNAAGAMLWSLLNIVRSSNGKRYGAIILDKMKFNLLSALQSDVHKLIPASLKNYNRSN